MKRISVLEPGLVSSRNSSQDEFTLVTTATDVSCVSASRYRFDNVIVLNELEQLASYTRVISSTKFSQSPQTHRNASYALCIHSQQHHPLIRVSVQTTAVLSPDAMAKRAKTGDAFYAFGMSALTLVQLHHIAAAAMRERRQIAARARDEPGRVTTRQRLYSVIKLRGIMQLPLDNFPASRVSKAKPAATTSPPNAPSFPPRHRCHHLCASTRWPQ
jgi:hypothetical protein